MVNTRTQFAPGTVWPDDTGTHINAHGGGILVDEGVFYWFGEHKIAGDAGNVAHVGVHCCLCTTGKYVRVFNKRWHEAPAFCKHNGRYWMITSDCTGWAPNAARSSVADSIWGPWRELGNPTKGINPDNGIGPEKTFGGQSTYILAVPRKADALIAMFDLWRPENAIDGRYLWLPMRFEDNKPTITWRSEWDLSVFDDGDE